MSVGHHGGLYRHGHSRVHQLPAQVKIVAAVLFTLIVVATPRDHFWAFGGYAAVLAVTVAAAKLPATWVARRSLIEVPFVVLALILPFTGPEPSFELGPLTLSESGALAGWNILAKGTLGVITSIVLAATTTVEDLLLGLQRLRLPEVLVQIAAFMVRYLAVITDQARRMQIARISRGHDPRFLWQAAVFARTLGALFIRSFERGERVYLAMISRGYTGKLPMVDAVPATRSAWLCAALLPLSAAALLAATWRI